MLQLRVITASILAALLALAVFFLPPEYFSLLIAIITLGGAWEWSNLAGVKSLSKRLLFLVSLLLPMLGVFFWTQFLELAATIFDWPEIRSYSGILEWLVVPPILFWLLIMFVIRNAPNELLQMSARPIYKLAVGWFVLQAVWMFYTRIKAFYGAEMMMYFILLIWAADVSAYFVGRRFGKTKLSPEISPGKTMEGMYGALIAAVVCAITLSLIYGFDFMIASDFVLLSVLTVLISIYGDLFISVLKRQRGLKDTSSLLPGHGGILDRIDSVVAATPFFYAGVLLIYRSIE